MIRIVVLGFILVSVGSAVRSEDGAIEINQLCVASGCFTGDDPGFPVEINAPGSYRLTSNLSVPAAESGIAVQVDNVTLDLAGNALLGPVDCNGPDPTCSPSTTGIGIDASGIGRISIFNGTVRGFGTTCVAIAGSAVGTPGMLLRDLVISDCGSHGIDAAAPGNIESITVFDNGARGAWLSSLVTVRDSTFRNNGSQGVFSGICRSNFFSANGDAAGVPEEGCTVDDGTNICGAGPCP